MIWEVMQLLLMIIITMVLLELVLLNNKELLTFIKQNRRTAFFLFIFV